MWSFSKLKSLKMLKQQKSNFDTFEGSNITKIKVFAPQKISTFNFKRFWSIFCAISRNFSQIKNARIFKTRSKVTLPGFLIPPVREGNSSRFAWESCSEGWVSDFQILRNSFWWKMAFLVHFCPFVASRMRETLELIVP